MRGRRGITLLEVLVALTVLGAGVTGLRRVVAEGVATVAADADASRAMLLARALLADAAVHPPEPGRTEGLGPGGLRFERDVERTPHPRLRQVRVRVSAGAPGTTCELVELVRVPAG